MIFEWLVVRGWGRAEHVPVALAQPPVLGMWSSENCG